MAGKYLRREKTFIVDEYCIFRGAVPCRKPRRTRGLCDSHYQSLWVLIEVEGRGTWEEAEEIGLCAPKTRGVKDFYLREIERHRTRKLA